MALTFGVTSTGGYGLLQSLTESETGEMAEARNETGKVVKIKVYSKTKEASTTGIFNGDSLDGAGASLTVGSVTGLITSQVKTQENTGYQRIDVTVQTKDAAELEVYA